MNDMVSIIIPTYNRPTFLERSIKSVLKQTYKNIEVIVVDDNGDRNVAQEETIKIMGKFKNYPHVRYIINEKNVGGAESRNIGVKNAKGIYISFLDDDDIYDENKIQEQIKVLKENQNIDVCYCGMTYLNTEGVPIGKRDIYVEGSEDLIEKHIFRPITGTPALLMKKNIFEEVNGFDNLKRYQDANLIFKILANNYNLSCVKKELVKVYIHNEERISTNGEWVFMEREYIKNTQKYIGILSYKNTKRLIDKLHIQNCYCNNSSSIEKLIKSFRVLKGRAFIPKNFMTILNYYRKS